MISSALIFAPSFSKTKDNIFIVKWIGVKSINQGQWDYNCMSGTELGIIKFERAV